MFIQHFIQALFVKMFICLINWSLEQSILGQELSNLVSSLPMQFKYSKMFVDGFFQVTGQNEYLQVLLIHFRKTIFNLIFAE